MSGEDARLQELLDERSIRNTIARFADAATFADLDGFLSVWAEDGVWSIGAPFEQEAHGLDAITQMIQRLWAPNDYFVHITTPPLVTIDGNRATVRGLVHEEARGPNGRFYRNNAISRDVLVRRGDEWVFAQRDYRYLFLDLSAFDGDTFMSFPEHLTERPAHHE